MFNLTIICFTTMKAHFRWLRTLYNFREVITLQGQGYYSTGYQSHVTHPLWIFNSTHQIQNGVILPAKMESLLAESLI